MAYEKNTWQSGDVVTSAKLNNIENGIANCNGAISVTVEGSTITLSASYNDILNMISAGVVPFIIFKNADGNNLFALNLYDSSEGDYYTSFNNHDFTATSADELLSAEM